jgi:hypothetical protein
VSTDTPTYDVLCSLLGDPQVPPLPDDPHPVAETPSQVEHTLTTDEAGSVPRRTPPPRPPYQGPRQVAPGIFVHGRPTSEVLSWP